MAASIKRFGLKGDEANDSLKRNMNLIREFVRNIEAISDETGEAA